MSKNRAALALITLLPLAGCGPELLGGAERGEVRTVATSDEGGSTQQTAPDGTSPSLASAPAGSAADADRLDATSAENREIQGAVLVDAAAWLITQDGDAVALTDGQVPGTFRIEGTGEALLGRADVEARAYTAVRVVFTRITAVVEDGLVLGGVPIVGPVHVDLGASGSTTVERPVDLRIEAHTTQTLVIDLDAHEWLPLAVLPGPIVPAHLFAAAVDIRFR